MSTINYNLNRKGVRLISSNNAWIIGKNGKPRLNPKYHFVGKIDTDMPNVILSPSNNQKPNYRGDVAELPRPAKQQLVNHFFDENGKRNKKTVAYFGIERPPKK